MEEGLDRLGQGPAETLRRALAIDGSDSVPPVPGTAAQVDVAPEDMHRLVFLTWGRHLDV